MNLQILNDKLKELENELKDIRKQLEKAEKEQESGRWKPQLGELYYYINNNGSLSRVSYDNAPFDQKIMTMGNYFATREEAMFETERLKVLAEMKDFEESPERKWNRDNDHYYITWNHLEKEIYIDFELDLKHDDIYFESLKKAQECIDKIGINRIKKYYLRIKED